MHNIEKKRDPGVYIVRFRFMTTSNKVFYYVTKHSQQGLRVGFRARRVRFWATLAEMDFISFRFQLSFLRKNKI